MTDDYDLGWWLVPLWHLALSQFRMYVIRSSDHMTFTEELTVIYFILMTYRRVWLLWIPEVRSDFRNSPLTWVAYDQDEMTSICGRQSLCLAILPRVVLAFTCLRLIPVKYTQHLHFMIRLFTDMTLTLCPTVALFWLVAAVSFGQALATNTTQRTTFL
jgi:hypothetical protein